MKRVFLLSLTLCFLACNSARRPVVITTKKEARKVGYNPKPQTSNPKTNPTTASPEVSTPEAAVSSKSEDIINTALSYRGTPYKYSGTTRSGMDCSGLVYTSFAQNDISLQRASYLMANQGKRIKRSQARPGDLVFFITDKRKNRINHVGLVVEVEGNDIKFIHATTSRGVLISSINEDYWNKAFVEARNIL